jgi:hypothetical protein
VTRFNKILAGLLAVQVALAVVMMIGNTEPAPPPLAPVLAGFDATKVQRVQVFEAPADGKPADKPAIDLVKDGDAWKLASHFGYPADPIKITELTDKLAAMKSRGPMARGAARHKQLGVADDDFERKLIVGAGGKETTLLVGRGAGGRTTAVRLAGSDEIFGVTGLTAWGVDTMASRWVSPEYFTLDKEQITQIVVQRPDGAVELDKSSGSWQIAVAGQPVVLGAGESLDTGAIDRAIDQVAKLQMYEPGDPARDASAPLATISIWTKPAEPTAAASVEREPDYVIDVVDDKERYWVHERNRPTAAMVQRGSLENIVKLSREKLVTAPTPPAGPPAGNPIPTPPAPIKPAPKPAPTKSAPTKSAPTKPVPPEPVAPKPATPKPAPPKPGP